MATEYLPDLGVYIQERPRAKTRKIILSPHEQDIAFADWRQVRAWAESMRLYAENKMIDEAWGTNGQ